MDKSSLLRNRKYTSKNSEMLFYEWKKRRWRKD